MLGLQVFMGNSAPSPGRLKAVTGERRHVKPVGGLWTSTYDQDDLSGWARWCMEEEFIVPPYRYWLLEAHPAARIHEIDDEGGLRAFVDRYRSAEAHAVEDLPVDWLAISRDWDAIHLTDEGQLRTRFAMPYSLYGWDCESTVWFRWSFRSVSEERVWAPAAEAVR